MKNDYKNTLNLPKTSFSMKANLTHKEPMMLKKWEKEKHYNIIRKHFLGKKQFIIHDGPPYANGKIHLGHAVNKILKDIIIRSKTLSGYDTPLIPGWDCHGLPIELEVEKILHDKLNIDNNIFRKKCRAYALKQIKLQEKDFKRLGIMADWDNPYLTMNFEYEANVVRSLNHIIKNNYLVSGIKPVYWCTECKSALAEAEVEYKNKVSLSIYVKFKIFNKTLWEKTLNLDLCINTSIVIWTTTPWTLPANEAVAINHDIEYSLINYNIQEYIIIAKDLVKSIMNMIHIEKYNIITTFLGNHLQGLTLEHPFYKKIIKIINGHHVSNDTGTGFVHLAPAYGTDDFKISKLNNINIHDIIDDHGLYNKNISLFAGKSIFFINDYMLKILKSNDRLLNSINIKHQYPYCWRHNKNPLIFRSTPQWFISMKKNNLIEETNKNLLKIKWMPLLSKNRITKMLKNRPDWCISRQRTWGIPITLYIHKITKKIHPKISNIINKAAELIQQHGIESWFIADDKEFINKNEINTYEKVTDTLDVWFDSGASHLCLDNKINFPVDLYIEGSDQHRGWFQSSLLLSIIGYKNIPCKEIITHGFILDCKGKKMSKSIGNVISPQDIVNKLGADILRLWIATNNYHYDMTVSDEILNRIVDIYRKIRNTARFILSNLNDFDLSTELLHFDDLIMLDKWAISKTYEIQNKIIAAYNEYKFHEIIQYIHHFCSFDMGSFYFDIIKDRQYTTKTNGFPRKSSQTAMYHIINALVLWISPILSFTAHEIYEYIPNNTTPKKDLIICEWYKQLNSFSYNIEDWDIMQKIKTECNKIIEEKRMLGSLGSSLEAKVTIVSNELIYNILYKVKNELHFLLLVSSVELSKLKTQSISTNIPEFNIIIEKLNFKKCERCWHRTKDVGVSMKDPNICQRCITNLYSEEGEIRYFF